MTHCPRCTGPLAAFPGELGAGSRIATDRSIRICGYCAVDEAVRDAATLAPIATDEWPVNGNLTWASLSR